MDEKIGIAFVGCGDALNAYMHSAPVHPQLQIRGAFDADLPWAERAATLHKLTMYEDLEALLADPAVKIVIDLTNLDERYGSIRQALLAGKHVFTEPPIARSVDQVRELFAIAAKHERVLSAGPHNLFSGAISTAWKALSDGAIGQPKLVFAELNDKLEPHTESMVRRTGESADTSREFLRSTTIYRGVSNHLVWMCALFGPARSVTTYARGLLDEAAGVPAGESVADFSVTTIGFSNGMSARLTLSHVAPFDRGFRIVGTEGELSADDILNAQSPVFVERFVSNAPQRPQRSAMGLPRPARRAQRIKLLRRERSPSLAIKRTAPRTLKARVEGWLFPGRLKVGRLEVEDRLSGVVEMARALLERRPQPLTPDFLIHLSELTLSIQHAGADGGARELETSFAPLSLPSHVIDLKLDYGPHFSSSSVLS